MIISDFSELELKYHPEDSTILVAPDGNILSLRCSTKPKWFKIGPNTVIHLKLKDGSKVVKPASHITYVAFNGEIIPGNVIHHKDANRSNNHYTNLVQLTSREHSDLHDIVSKRYKQILEEELEKIGERRLDV